MKKKLLLALVLFTGVLKSYADEGMWLPMLLGQQVYDNMVKRGLKLSKEQLFSINKASIKDAIIIFGGGCTGEIVSDQGLIFTNHHCGYDAIAKASSVKNNYLQDGFYAFSKDQEIPSALTVQFLDKIVDVTAEVEAGLKGLAWKDRSAKINDVYKTITDKYKDDAKGQVARVYSMFKDNQYIMYVFKVYKDIRLVGTPPESVGKFGGDTDNWEWPRHTGDFSIFRVYTAPDGSPAAYSRSNVPMKPKYFLPVSIKGFKDGDYSMIYGYPGSTNRYETSYGIKLKNDIENPSLVGLRDMRLKYMHAQMVKDPAVKLKLASDYAGIANYWKFFDGETKQLQKYKVYNQKQDYETAYNKWANGKSDYANVMNDYQSAYNAWTPYAKARVYYREGILGSPLIAFASKFAPLEKALSENKSAEEISKYIAALDGARTAFKASEDIPSDKQILAAATKMYYDDVDATQRPADFYSSLSSAYGPLNADFTFNNFSANVFDNTMLLDDSKWEKFKQKPDLSDLRKDPAYAYASAFTKTYNDIIMPQYNTFTARNNELGRSYLKGIREMNPAAAAKMYPDANFSMRVSYGNVKSYSPKDAIVYDYVTTSRGILEKYVPGDYEFDLPAKQVELLRKRDFGQYIDKAKNDLVVGFITTNDITGGNSGSPVMDGSGNLIGLAFDGNYEALSHKIAFDKDLNRTICVDVRYVLWCIDKLGGAKNIINELKLVR